MAATTHLPAIRQVPVARKFPKVWEHRKELSRWTSREVPSLKLAAQLDTDHWAKLKRKHINYMHCVSYGSPSNDQLAPNLHSTKSTDQVNAFQRFYYEQSRHRQELLKKSYAMYYQGKPMKNESEPNGRKESQPSAQRRPSVYNQRAKGGFKFWLERDPMVNKITLCSKYTFGSKSTFHGLGNAPRN